MSGDPVLLGIVPSINRPAGNPVGSEAANLELLHQLVPNATKLGVLADPNAENEGFEKVSQEAAANSGFSLVIARASGVEGFEAAFGSLADQDVGGLVITGAAQFVTQHDALAALATRYGLPTVFPNGDLSRSGGLMTYGPSLPTMFHTMGEYAAKILKGARPSDLPIIQPTTYHTVVNLRAAKALGLTVPTSLLARADQVIK
jgi:ABC-type uncharacterized transport system substrate-binding protein